MVSLWIAIFPAVLPAGAVDLKSESVNYRVSAHLVGENLVISIVDKTTGRQVSNKEWTRAATLSKVCIREKQGKAIVHGQVASGRGLQLEFLLIDASRIVLPYMLVRKSGDTSVWVLSRVQREGRGFYVDVSNKTGEVDQSNWFPTRAANLTDLHLLKAHHRAIICGQLAYGADVLTVVDTRDVSVVDIIYGGDASFSPNKTMVAFYYMDPPHSMKPNATSGLLIYDFLDTPRGNSRREANLHNPQTRGYVIYPARNRRLRRHFIPGGSEETNNKFVSPISWSRSGAKVAFMEALEGDTYLLLVDISNGLEDPEITRTRLEKKRFYKERVGRRGRSEYQSAVVSAKSLRFAEDDKSVFFTTREDGPFAELEAEIKLD